MAEGIEIVRAIWFNSEGNLRCGWRVVAFVLALIGSGIVLSTLLQTFATLFPALKFLAVEPSSDEYLSQHELWFLIVNKLITFGATIVSTIICARLLERRGFLSVGYKLHRGWVRDFSFGSILGSASLALAVGISFVVGSVSFQVQATRDASLVSAFWIALVFMLISGATEELMFRGFAFQALSHDLGPAAALFGTSVLFGLLHLPNPGSTFFSTVNTILAGVWLGAAYLMTRSLWLATALHYSWNFAQSFLFGLPVSGITTMNRLSWLHGVSGPPGWLSGLEYGPEGGAAATLALIFSTLLLWKAGLFSISEEMKDAAKPRVIEVMPSIIPPSAPTKT